nr:hypothetical protein CFP56_11564 [Quercus suber]
MYSRHPLTVWNNCIRVVVVVNPRFLHVLNFLDERSHNMYAYLLAFASIATAGTTSAVSGDNTFPTALPVTAFPVSTQTHFDSPSCTSGPSSQQEMTINYNFETVERIDPLIATTQIGVYNLLNFIDINAVETDPDLDGNHLGIAPYTYPNVATFGVGTQLEGALTLQGTVPIITANYTESTIKSWTPHSWFYGCVFPFPITAGSLPSNCTITAQGYSSAGRKIASALQTFTFAANGSLIQNQNYATFNQGFKGIYSLALSVDSASSAALVDNLIATVTQDSLLVFLSRNGRQSDLFSLLSTASAASHAILQAFSGSVADRCHDVQRVSTSSGHYHRPARRRRCYDMLRAACCLCPITHVTVGTTCLCGDEYHQDQLPATYRCLRPRVPGVTTAEALSCTLFGASQETAASTMTTTRRLHTRHCQLQGIGATPSV